jgi:hypothetical protein
MAIVIDGTNGVSGVDGSAGTPAVQGSDTNTGVFFPAADTAAIATGGSERMRIDSSGNLGLGVTPSAWGSGWTAFQVKSGGAALWADSGSQRSFLSTNLYYNGTNRIYQTTGAAVEYAQNVGNHVWSIAPSGTAGNTVTLTQAMTLDTSGNLLVGTASQIGSGTVCIPVTGGTNWAIAIQNTNTSTASNIVFRNSSSTTVGTVQSTTTTTSYNTSSDYRLKNAIAPMTGALAKVALLKPVTYKWKVDGSDGEGFIAHELAEVCPDAVTGEKDAVDADGNPVYQGIDTSFLVATLTAAIQEQQAIIEQLKADVAALK